MNASAPIRTASPELAPQASDPLDHLVDILFHRMGNDGVYARTALYEDVVERLAAHAAHREEEPALGVGAEVVDRDDRRVLEARGDLDLAAEPAREPRRCVRKHLLERDRAAELGVERLDDAAHATAPELGPEPEALAGR